MEDAGGRGRPRSTVTATAVERPRSTTTATAVERPRSTSTATAAADPRRSFLHRQRIQNDHEADMDRGWMSFARSTTQYSDGVKRFIEFAVRNSGKNGKILCPCSNCGNRFRLGREEVHEHLIWTGFMSGYTSWVYHGYCLGAAENREVENEESDEMEQLLVDGFGIYDSNCMDTDSDLEDQEGEGSADECDEDAERSTGVLIHDAAFGKKFRVYAALLWTISDWLGRGLLSGESIAVCSHCLTNTCSRRLKHGKKRCYMGNRRFLDPDHSFRSDAASFDGTTEYREPPVQPSSLQISEMTKGMMIAYGKLQKPNKSGRRKRPRVEGDENLMEKEEEHTVETTFKKRSVFFQLEYWETLQVRHNLDPMHIQKNFFDNIMNTILNVDKRSKDNLNSRRDLKRLKIREGLHVNETQPKPDLPEAEYYMNSDAKKIFCGVIKHARFPDGYASSLYDKVSMEEKRLHGLKTHHIHIIMQDLFSLAVSSSLPEHVALPLIQLSNYFKVVCGKVINVVEVQNMEAIIPEIMCQLEKIFPPTFFDIMEHVTIHLATEVRLAGPAQFRDMWSTENFIGYVKNMVHTRSHPEGSIAEGYVLDESMTFCSRYLHGAKTKLNLPARHNTSGASSSSYEYLVKIGRPLSASAVDELDHVSWTQAQRYVLFNYPKISSYSQKHLHILSAGRSNRRRRDVESAHHSNFHTWFTDHVNSEIEKGIEVQEEVFLLAQRPYMMVKKYNSYSINGCHFHTSKHGQGKSTQCDGVSVCAKTSSYSSAKDKNPALGNVQYYGRITEIVELNYSNKGHVVLFKCVWVKPTGVRKDDKFGITRVNFSHLHDGSDISSEPFILASQAKQIYYVQDPIDAQWHAVVSPPIRDFYDMKSRNDSDDEN